MARPRSRLSTRPAGVSRTAASLWRFAIDHLAASWGRASAPWRARRPAERLQAVDRPPDPAEGVAHLDHLEDTGFVAAGERQALGERGEGDGALAHRRVRPARPRRVREVEEAEPVEQGLDP